MSPKCNFVLPANCSAALDFIRAVSAQMVLVGHAISYFGIFNFLQPPILPYMQNVAVLLFFLLSGLLISYSVFTKLDNYPGYRFAEYFIDRFSRIYTSYLPSILFVLLLDFIYICLAGSNYGFATAFSVQTFIGNLFMLQDYPVGRYISLLHVTSFGSARPFWSLAVEWWIYLWFGWFVYNYYKKEQNRNNWYVHLIFIFFCIVPIWNMVFGRGNGLTFVWLMGSGVCLILAKVSITSFRPKLSFILSAAFLTLATIRVVRTKIEYDVLFAGLLGLFLLFLLIGLHNSTFSFGKTFDRRVRFVANYSFTLYLTHYSILDFAHYLTNGIYSPYLIFVLSFLICNFVAAFIAYFSEFRHKYVASRLKQLLPRLSNT
ncbi:acyltransferase family protein [Anaeroselena agilis]|uniref:Acyltransferase family protein n=1 Tax=Anaeroselena agilis TaxID=3063788 RepID=A0ABU3P465_9FIRM|nr:acyltransferase family protein [Selenomonadales bacterium 4137-cl]